MAFSALRMCAAAALLAGLNACTFWSGDFERIVDQSERDFDHHPAAEYKWVDLRQVLATPTSYKYVDIRFEAIMNRVGEGGFAPMWTTFTPEDYLSFSAWPADADLWITKVRGQSHPLFFVRKENKSIASVVATGRYSLVRVTGRVMGDYEQKAWILVNTLEVLEKEVYTDDGLASLALADAALSARNVPDSIRHFESSLDGVWLTDLRTWVHLELARLYEGQGNLEQALVNYEAVLGNDPQNPMALEGRDRVVEALEARPPAAPKP